MQSLQINPYMAECGEGQRLEAWGAGVIVKAGTVETGGTFNLLEVTGPTGFATPLHIHYAEDVAVYVLDGCLTVYWGDEKKEATVGSYFFQPRATPGNSEKPPGASPAAHERKTVGGPQFRLAAQGNDGATAAI